MFEKIKKVFEKKFQCPGCLEKILMKESEMVYSFDLGGPFKVCKTCHDILTENPKERIIPFKIFKEVG